MLYTGPNARTDAVQAGAIKDIVTEQPVQKETVKGTIAAPETKPFINQDKTCEQVMAEAFERIYEKINKMLDQIPEDSKDQFQLQRMV